MKQKIIFGFVFYALTQTAFSAELTSSSPAETVKVEAPVVAEKAQEKFVAIEKRIDLPGIILNEKLSESIGIETLADVVTPLISKGSSLPSTTLPRALACAAPMRCNAASGVLPIASSIVGYFIPCTVP